MPYTVGISAENKKSLIIHDLFLFGLRAFLMSTSTYVILFTIGQMLVFGLSQGHETDIVDCWYVTYPGSHQHQETFYGNTQETRKKSAKALTTNVEKHR